MFIKKIFRKRLLDIVSKGFSTLKIKVHTVFKLNINVELIVRGQYLVSLVNLDFIFCIGNTVSSLDLTLMGSKVFCFINNPKSVMR